MWVMVGVLPREGDAWVLGFGQGLARYLTITSTVPLVRCIAWF